MEWFVIATVLVVFKRWAIKTARDLVRMLKETTESWREANEEEAALLALTGKPPELKKPWWDDWGGDGCTF